jgi:WD40 repeat protein
MVVDGRPRVGTGRRGHTNWVRDVVHMPGRRLSTLTCSEDSSLRLWYVETSAQVGDSWQGGWKRDRDDHKHQEISRQLISLISSLFFTYFAK